MYILHRMRGVKNMLEVQISMVTDAINFFSFLRLELSCAGVALQEFFLLNGNRGFQKGIQSFRACGHTNTT